MTPSCQRSSSLALLVASFVATPHVSAEVNHRVVDIPIWSATQLDVDEDGASDFQSTPWGHWGSLWLEGATWKNSFLSEFSVAGSSVGPVPPEGPIFYQNTLTIWWQGEGSAYAIPFGTRYVGIEFLHGGEFHYGWLKIQVSATRPFVEATIVEIAWESGAATPLVVGWGDCNANGVNDVVEILSGADLPDCNGDLFDDTCQSDEDCNGNGLRDLCEADVPDCNGNLVPDSCEIAADPALDCNGDGLLDACLGPAGDCDQNGIPDACEALPPEADCNRNGAYDWCEINYDPSLDCDYDGQLDSCQLALDPAADCDGDGVLDGCAIAAEPWRDCDSDGMLDVCEIALDPDLDCDGDGALDACGATPFVGNVAALYLPRIESRLAVENFGQVMPTSEITIEFWQRVARPAQQTAFRLDWTESNRCMAHVPWSDGRVYWDFGDAGANGRLDYVPSEPIVGTWQHFAFQASASGNFMRIYRNGVLEAQKVGSDSFVPNNEPLVLGGTFYWEGFIGTLDEFRIWDHVRSAEEIASAFQGTVDPASPGLVAYWRLDEGSGDQATDLVAGRLGIIQDVVEWPAVVACSPAQLTGDINGDGTVDAADLAALLGGWGTASPGDPADLDGDGTIDGADLAVLLGNWS